MRAFCAAPGWALGCACVSLLTICVARGETDSVPVRQAGALGTEEYTTLSDYLRLAAENNRGLEAAYHRWQAALAEIPRAASPPQPRLTYGYFISEVETKVGPQQHRIGLSQSLPWPSKLSSRRRIGEHAAAAAQAEYESARQELLLRVKSVYFDLYYLEAAIAVTEENVLLLRSLERVILARYRSGDLPHSTLIRAQVELGKLEDRLASLRERRRPAAAAMNALLNRPTDSRVSFPRSLPESNLNVHQDRLSSLLENRNPELLAARHRVDKQDEAAGLAGRSAWPDLVVGVDYLVTGHSDPAGTPDSGKDPIIAMLGISLPLWRGRIRGESAAGRSSQVAAASQYADRRLLLQAELESALYGYRDAGRQVRLYGEELLPKATQSLEVTRQSFEAGRSDFSTFVDAQRLLLEFSLQLERARVEKARSLARIEGLVATPVEQMPESEVQDAH